MINGLAATLWPRGIDKRFRQWRVLLSAAALFFAAVTASLAVGYYVAAERTLRRERALAQDIGRSTTRIINAVEQERQRLARIAGLPCTQALARFTENDRTAPYVRSVFFARNSQIYCNTVSGASNAPLSALISPSDAATQIAIRPGTPLFPNRPVMIVYGRASGDAGMGLIVQGTYIDDLLGRAQAMGAQLATVIASDGSGLTSKGRYLASVSPDKGHGTYSAPQGIFSILVEAGAAWRRQDMTDVESIALLFGGLSGASIAIGYLALLTPRLRLIRRVRRGLADGEFFVVYQPIVEVATGEWVGAEALVRWQHPRWGLVMPGDFIDDVESTPVIAGLTQFVLSRALAEIGAMELPDGFKLSVNLSAFHIGLRHFPGDLLDILRASRPRLQVSFEITERSVLSDLDDVKDRLMLLQSHGIKFSIDDFGAEYSNLALLRRFHFDYIKIDRQFVHGIASGGLPLLESIVFLAKQVGAVAVVEGVEDQAQRRILETINVPLAQGYLFAMPGPAREFAQGYEASLCHCLTH